MSNADEQATPIHLVLGSGGARGLAHIGVVKVLRERGFRIDSITGCSMGALVGALIVSKHMEAYEEWVCQLTRRDVLRFLDISLLGRSGMVKGDRLMEQLEGWLGGVQMQDLAIPLTVVAADIAARKEVWITHGDLLEAVRASIAVPGVFTPLVKHGRILVDGGILNPLPIPPTRIDTSALTLAVSVSGREVAHPLGRTLDDRDASSEAALSGGGEDGYPEDDWHGSEEGPDTTSIGGEPTVADDEGHQRIEGFLDSLQRYFGRDRNSVVPNDDKSTRESEGRLSDRPALTDVMLGMFGTMQDIIARHQIAGNPPDILIDIPRNVCQSHEFYRAREVIDAGAYWASRALDEQSDDDHSMRGSVASRAWRLS